MWVRIDDRMPRHPKFENLSVSAAWLWVCGNCYASSFLTDGFVSKGALGTLSIVPIPDIQQQVDQLVQAGLWHVAPGGYRIHDYHDYNPSAEQLRAKLAADRQRKRSAQTPTFGRLAQDSAQTPSGLHTDSIGRPERVSERNPKGIAADSDAPRARDPVPSRPVPSKKPEQGARPLDECWVEFQAEYPSERRQGGFMAERGFLGAVEKFPDGYGGLLERLRQHKRSEQWAVAKKIPAMRKWFEDELWRQELAPPNGNGHGAKGSEKRLPPSVDEIRRANERPQ